MIWELDSHSFSRKYPNSASKLSDVSLDKANNHPMIDDDRPIINFDHVKDQFAQSISPDGKKPKEGIKSADGYFQSGGRDFFVEFKNGKIDEKDLLTKIYDTAIVFCNLVNKSPEHLRLNGEFILVYNPNKIKKNLRARIEAIDVLAGPRSDRILHSIYSKVKGYLFNEVHECTPEEFEERFLSP